MSEDIEYRCFVGGLSWSTSDRVLKEAFEKFGSLVEAKVKINYARFSLSSFLFISFSLYNYEHNKHTLFESISLMNTLEAPDLVHKYPRKFAKYKISLGSFFFIT